MEPRSIEEVIRFLWLAWVREAGNVLLEFDLEYEDVLTLSVIAYLASLTMFPTQGKLARALGVDAVWVTRRLAGLETRGLVGRRWSEYDRRLRRVFLTRKGRTVLAACEERFVRLREDVFPPGVHLVWAEPELLRM